MEDLAVVLYRKRREERLASRGIRVKKKQYRKSKDGKKLDEPEIKSDYHNDAEDSENNENGGTHGNTKLPFGLCQRYGIEIGSDWTPKDAWDALAGKGITPEWAYKKLRAGEEIIPDDAPEPPKDPVKIVDKGKYYVKDLKARHTWGPRGSNPWALEGTPEWKDSTPEEDRKDYRSPYCGPKFTTLTDLYVWLKRAGIEEFEDPETGELVNPSQMELPEPVWEDSGHGYSAMTIGMKKDRYAIYGTDFDGKKVFISDAGSLEMAQDKLMRMGVPDDAISLSPTLKKREEDRLSWLTSDKKEYYEDDGVKYGDLRIIPPDKDDFFGSHAYTLIGEDERGNKLEKEFRSEKDALAFLMTQGVERVRGADRKYVNPQEAEIPKPVAQVGNKYYQKLKLLNPVHDAFRIEGTDLDGEESIIEWGSSSETYNEFMEKMEERYGITESMLDIDDDVREWIEQKKKDEAEQEARRKAFAEKAVWLAGRRYSDLHIKEIPDAPGVFELAGYNAHGQRVPLCCRSIGPIAEEYLEKYEIDPSQIEMDDKAKEAFEDYKRRKAEFETISEPFDGKRYADIELMKEDDGRYRLYGYDQEGELRRLTYSGGLHSILLTMESQGLKDPEKYIKSDVVKKDYQEHRKFVAEFEKRAEDIDGFRLADVEVKTSASGRYRLVGTAITGEPNMVITGENMYELAKSAEDSGIDLGKYCKDEMIKAEYNEYKKRMARFETEAETFHGSRFLDIEADYDPEKKKYFLHGTTVSGERGTPLDAKTETEFRKHLEDGSGKKLEDFKCSDRMKERLKQVKKARDAVASGEYYDMGVDGHAFKDVYAQKSDSKWTIRGTDEGGKDRKIADAKDWDDAVATMESFEVTDYKMLANDRTYGRPTDGMRHVILAKEKDGVFHIFADSETKGTHAEVYSCENEEDARKWLSDNNVDSAGLRTTGMNPNDNVPRTHTQKSLERFDTHRMEAVSGSIIDDMTEDEKNEAAEMLKTLFTHGAYRCARSTNSFGLIIDDRYKSQMETGTAGFGASHNKRARERCSKKMYGHSGHIDLEDRDYEKCGYLGADDDAYDYDQAYIPHYGGGSPCVYTFRKDRMKDRASYTFGDSLNTAGEGYLKAAGYAGENPTLEGLTAVGSVLGVQRALQEYRKYKKGEISFNEMFSAIKSRLENFYIEMQYNGDVTVEDIEKVTFRREDYLKNAFDHMDSELRKRVIKKLKANNVQILYRKDNESPFEDAWGYIKQNYAEDFV